MRARTVLILLGLVVGLVAFIELYEHELPSSEERTALGKLVLTTDPLEITAVEIESVDHHVRLEREGEVESDVVRDDLAAFQWHLVEPMTARADGSLVVPLIEMLTDLEKKRILEDADPAEIGLDPPRFVVHLFTGDHRSSLLVGSEVPAGSSMIVRVDGEPEVFVVDSMIWPDLNRDSGDWRDRQVVNVAQDLFQRIVLKSEGGEISLARRGREFWLEGSIVDRAGGERVGELLTDLASMRVVSFLDEPEEPLAGMGLDPALREVEITTAAVGVEPLRLAWGSGVPDAEGQTFARLGDQIFTTDADLSAFFDTSVEEWRSLELTTMETFQIDDVEIDSEAHQPLDLGREGANWRRNDELISFTSVSDLLYSIADASAVAVHGSQTPLAQEIEGSKPLLELSLRGANHAQTLAFYAARDQGVPAVVGDRQVVLILGQDEFTEILANVARIRAEEAIKIEVDEQLVSDDPDLTPDQ